MSRQVDRGHKTHSNKYSIIHIESIIKSIRILRLFSQADHSQNIRLTPFFIKI